jgi:hypothetical protein
VFVRHKTKSQSVNKKPVLGRYIQFFGMISWRELKSYQKIAQLTERKKEQHRFHARFIGSAAAASSLAARRRRSAWQRGCTARRQRGHTARCRGGNEDTGGNSNCGGTNNQQSTKRTETRTMTAMTITIETKGTVVAA